MSKVGGIIRRAVRKCTRWQLSKEVILVEPAISVEVSCYQARDILFDP